MITDRQIRAVYEQSGLVSCFFSARGEVLHVSGDCAGLLGLDPEALKQNPKRLLDVMETGRAHLAGALSGGMMEDVRFDVLVRGGGVFQCEGGTVTDEADEAEYYLLFRRQDQSGAQHRLHEQRLMQMDKLATVGTLAAGIAHEVNNPACFITMNVPILQEVWGALLEHMPLLEDAGVERLGAYELEAVKETLPDLVDGIMKGADRIRRIVKSLKQYARTDFEDEATYFSLNDVLRSMEYIVANKVKRATNCFEMELDDDPQRVLGHFQQIEQVVINLIVNACEALTGPAQAVRVRVTHDEHRVYLQVSDEGRGISEENLERVCDPYYTTKKTQESTGLGLFISAQIVSDHQGRLRFASDGVSGTVATMELPLARYGAA